MNDIFCISIEPLSLQVCKNKSINEAYFPNAFCFSKAHQTRYSYFSFHAYFSGFEIIFVSAFHAFCMIFFLIIISYFMFIYFHQHFIASSKVFKFLSPYI